MKFLVEQVEIKKALQNMNSCISKSNSIVDITLGVLLEVDDAKLVLQGTNLNTFMQKVIPIVKSQENGKILVKFDLLKGLIDKFPPGIIEFELVGNEMELRQNKIKYRVPTYSNIDEFPKKPQIIEGPSFEIPQNLLMEIIKKTVKGLKRAENTPYLCGMYINILKNQTVDFVSTDTFRLSLYNYVPEEIFYYREKGAIVPYETLDILKSIISNTNEKIIIRFNDSHIKFVLKDITVISRLLYGTYPFYWDVIPDEFNGTVDINAKALQGALNRINTIAKFNGHSIAIMHINDDDLVVFPQGKNGEEFLKVDSNLENFSISLNIDYLMDFTNTVKSELITAMFIDSLNPMIWVEGKFIYVLMPTKQ